MARDCAAMLLEEQICYTYGRPISRLRHRLLAVPRAVHGSQQRRDFDVSVSDPTARIRVGRDGFANCVVRVEVGEVEGRIEFSLRATVAWRGEPAPEARRLLEDPRLTTCTRLTAPNDVIREVAGELAGGGAGPLEVAERACSFTSAAMTYAYGATGVRTTAAEALSGGTGVCQDYAHVMLALCRSAGVASRYVSGHLVGEGGSHAWVEVLDADRSGQGSVAVGFDPTHDRRTDSRYLTVAVGRDYADVTPTSGTFFGECAGELSVRKRLRELSCDDLAGLEPAAGELSA